MQRLRLTKDRKVSPWVSYGASGKSRNVLPNTFGLSAGVDNSCPGATDLCSTVCYAGRLEAVYTTVGRMLAHNLVVLRACNDDVDAMTALLVPLVEEYLDAAGRRERRQGRTFPRLFRIHWDGDFFSEPYARAWRATMEQFADVQFWTYTRSFTPQLNVVPVFHDLKNFTLYLSVDAQNYNYAKSVLSEFPDTLVSVLAGTVEGGKAVYRALTGLNAAACPEKIGKLDIVTHRGEGACITCGLCVWGRKGVVFPAANGTQPVPYPEEADRPPVEAPRRPVLLPIPEVSPRRHEASSHDRLIAVV